jgi:hypothetical protein
VKIEPRYKEYIQKLYRDNPEAAKKRYGDNPFEVKNIMKNWVRTKNEKLHLIPTDTLYIKIDRDAVLRSGMIIPEEYQQEMPEYKEDDGPVATKTTVSQGTLLNGM